MFKNKNDYGESIPNSSSVLATSNKLRSSANVISTERNFQELLSSFANIFPERNDILDMAQLSVDVFDDRAIISNPKFKFEHWIEPESSTTKAMIVTYEHGNSIIPVVVFRGTDEIEDWQTNMNIALVESKFTNAPNDVKVHQGFQSALFDRDIAENIEKKILDLIGEDGELIVTGHSLGGANAHIIATYLADRYPSMKVRMINFGAPRLGNKAFKHWTETELTNLSAWRIVYGNDFIPRAMSQRLGYRHAGHLFMFYRYRSKAFYRQVGERGRYKGAPWHWYYAYSITDHYLPVYLKYIKDVINRDQFWPNRFQ